MNIKEEVKYYVFFHNLFLTELIIIEWTIFFCINDND